MDSCKQQKTSAKSDKGWYTAEVICLHGSCNSNQTNLAELHTGECRICTASGIIQNDLCMLHNNRQTLQQCLLNSDAGFCCVGQEAVCAALLKFVSCVILFAWWSNSLQSVDANARHSPKCYPCIQVMWSNSCSSYSTMHTYLYCSSFIRELACSPAECTEAPSQQLAAKA